MEVRISEADLFGLFLYKVFVDEEFYDKFTSSIQLTLSERADVEAGYKEALDNYTPPV